MGVKCLHEVVKESKLLENFAFGNDNLVIDGSGLMYFLYFESKLDQRHGGDYVGFNDLVCQFFQSLKNCSIKSYVVLDGGSDCSDRKWDTQQIRFEHKIEKASKLACSSPGPNHYKCIIPPLTKDVFKQILHSQGVSFAQCFGEADSEISSLANTLECPVLSHDSDYYIYDLRAGFLPLTTFQWKRQENEHINTMRYMTANFCDHFKVDRALLPVFAAIAGNDYTQLEDKGRFSQLYPFNTSAYMYWEKRRLYSILLFLREMNLEKQEQEKQQLAVNKTLDLIRSVGEVKDQMRKDLLESIQIYAPPRDCPLALFFQNGTTPNKPEYLHVLPDWTLHPLTEGKLTSFIIDVLLRRRMVLSPQVENFYQKSGHHTARPIRQYLYGVLLGRDGDFVREYDRLKTDRCSSSVETKLSFEEVKPVPLTQTLKQPTERNEVFMKALGVAHLSLDTIPDHLKLPVCVIHFWQRHCHSATPNHLYALLLGVVYGDLCRQMEASPFTGRMAKMKKKGEKEPLRLAVAHSFSQWQCCLKESLHLNQLLRFPLPEPECSWLYCGPLVHQLVAELKGGESRARLTSISLLEGDTTSKVLFDNLLLWTRELRPAKS